MGLSHPLMAFFARLFVRQIGRALLCVLFISNSIYASDICEQELRAVRVLVKMVRNAIVAGDLNAQEVAHQYARGGWVNPFATRAKSPENLDRRNAFARVSRGFSLEQKNEFRALLQNEFIQLNQSQKLVEQAKVTERYIFVPKVLAEIPREFDNSGSNLFTFGVVNNRPVFVGLMTKDGRHSEYLIDYFRKDDPTKKIQAIGKNAPRDSFDSVGKILNWDGTDYFVRLEKETYINLQSGQDATGKFAKLLPPLNPGQRSKMENLGWEMVPTSKGPLVIAAWNGPQTESKGSFLGAVNLKSTDYTFTKVGDGAAVAPISVQNVNGHSILSWIPRGENRAHFYFAGDAGLEPIGSPEMQAKFPNSKRKALIYAKDESLLAIIPYDRPYDNPGAWNTFNVGIFDIRGKYIRDLPVPSYDTNQSHSLVHINGRLSLQIAAPNEIHFLDLETEHVTSLKTARLRGEPKTFDFRGRTYLALCTVDSKLEIYDAEAKLLVGSLHIGTPALQVIPFEFGDEPLAFVTRSGRAPIIIRLMDNGLEFKW